MLTLSGKKTGWLGVTAALNDGIIDVHTTGGDYGEFYTSRKVKICR